MSTTLVLHKRGIDLSLPSSKTGTKNEAKHVVISIDEALTIFADGEKISIESMVTWVKNKKMESPDLSITLEADKSVPYQHIISILDNIRMGGCYSILLNVKPHGSR